MSSNAIRKGEEQNILFSRARALAVQCCHSPVVGLAQNPQRDHSSQDEFSKLMGQDTLSDTLHVDAICAAQHMQSWHDER